MRVRPVHRSLVAAAGTATALLVLGLGAPAHAAEIASCGAGEGSILVEISSTAQDLTLSNESGFFTVQDNTGSWSCGTPTSQAGQVFLQLANNTSHRWLVDLATPFSSAVTGTLARVVLPNQPGEPIWVVSEQSNVGQQWTYLGNVGGSNNEFTLDGGSTSDLSLQPATGLLTLQTAWGNDTIDLWNGGTTPYPEWSGTAINSDDGNDNVKGGQTSDDINSGFGDDHVEGGPGPDSLYDANGQDTLYGGVPGNADSDSNHFHLTTDFWPDLVNPGVAGGFDWVSYDSFGEPIQVSIDGVPNDGAQDEGDNINGVTHLTTGIGDDRIESVHLQTIDSGPGNDTLLTHQDFTMPITQWDAGTGDDTIDFSAVDGAQVDGNVDTGHGSFDVEGYGIEVESVEAVIGSPQADNFQLVCACTVRPGLGNDTVQLLGDGAGFLADAGADGADTVGTTEDDASTIDYTVRTVAVSLSSDGDANDGAPGEGDNIGSEATTLIGGLGADTIVGSAVDNIIVGRGGANVLNGRGGNDRIEGGKGPDTLYGGSGNDRLFGRASADKLFGGDGDDRLLGDDAHDDATFGADTLDGGNGDDDEFGYAGNDIFLEGIVANGGDLIVGGVGTDLASYALRAAALKLTLNGLYDDGAAGEGDRIGNDVENLTGGKGADVITGNNVVNLLTGGLGKDALSGLGGNDVFQTLDGVIDSLNGGAGTDKAHRDATDKIVSVEQKF